MARVKSPFLSLGASGSIGDALTSAKWKGVKTVRAHAAPANPKTAAQTGVRSNFAVSVDSFRTALTDAATRTALNLLARTMSRTMSGYNAIISQMVEALKLDDDPSFVSSVAAAAGSLAEFTMINIDDGATGDEAGDFEILSGSAPGSLLLVESVAIVAGVVTSSSLGDADDVVYVQLRKAGVNRSGIYKLTLVAAPLADFVVAGNPDPDCSGNYNQNGTFNAYPAYEREDSAYWIFYDTDIGMWVIAVAKENMQVSNTWFDTNYTAQPCTPVQTYVAHDDFTGVPTVTAG